MKTLRNSAALLGGILLAPLSMAMAQTTDVAYASAPKAGYVVFLDRDGRLSSTADSTIRNAADAARTAGTIHLAGRFDHATAVKKELIRNGIPAGSIVVEPRVNALLPPTGDGIGDPSSRSVEIRF